MTALVAAEPFARIDWWTFAASFVHLQQKASTMTRRIELNLEQLLYVRQNKLPDEIGAVLLFEGIVSYGTETHCKHARSLGAQ